MQSMQEHDTFPGKVYAVTCASGCTITDNKGRTLGECEAGKQTLVVATSDKLLTSADALLTATFSAAPTIGSGSGGGASINFDDVPTQGSGNAVRSSGIYEALLHKGAKATTTVIGDGAHCTSAGCVVIGYNAKYNLENNNYANSVLIGANAKTGNPAMNVVAIGSGVKAQYDCIAIGGAVSAPTLSVCVGSVGASSGSTTIGWHAKTENNAKIALGADALASAAEAAAYGYNVKVKDAGVTAIGTWNADKTVQTLLYILSAGSPLAVTYEGGEAALGYLVKQTDGTVLACGTRKLSELLTNNTAFTPASMDLNADPPTPFLPTGAFEPIEFTEPEEYPENNV